MENSEATKKYLTGALVNNYQTLKQGTVIVLKIDSKLERFVARPFFKVFEPENPELENSPKEQVLNLAGLKTQIYKENNFPWYMREMQADYHATELLKAIPGRAIQDRKGHVNYVIPATEVTLTCLKEFFGIDRIRFADEPSRDALISIIVRERIYERLQLIQAKFKTEGIVPEIDKDVIPPDGITLSPYQKTAVQMLLDSPQGIDLFMEQGTGKTCVVISAVNADARKKRKVKKTSLLSIIVGPKNVVSNWSHEFAKFSSVQGTVIKVRGTKERRLSLIAHAIKQSQDPEVGFVTLVYSYDSFVSDSGMLQAIPWDWIITDESHYFKDSSTKRWQALKLIREFSTKRAALSGTPMANSIIDLYTQLEFIGPGESGFISLKDFKDFYIHYDESAYSPTGMPVAAGFQNIPFIQERLAKIAFSITKEEAGLDLPEKVYIRYEVEPTKEQIKAYVQLYEQLASEIEIDGAISTMEANNVLVKLLRLAQVCSGHAKVTGPDGFQKVIQLNPYDPAKKGEPNPKVSGMLDMILTPENDPNMKTIIACSFIEDIRVIAEALDRHGIKYKKYFGATNDAERDIAEREFNEDPELKVLIVNPATAGVGLNLLGYNHNAPEEEQLDTYTGQIIFFSQDWSMLKRAQMEDRAHRRGLRKHHQLKIVDLLIPDTVDEVIRERVSQKRKTADFIQDIKNILKEVLATTKNIGGFE